MRDYQRYLYRVADRALESPEAGLIPLFAKAEKYAEEFEYPPLVRALEILYSYISSSTPSDEDMWKHISQAQEELGHQMFSLLPGSPWY